MRGTADRLFAGRHLSADGITAFVTGRVTQQELRAIVFHTSVCAHCVRALVEASNAAARTDDKLQDLMPA